MLTLSQPEGADYAHYINTDPRIFRPSYGPALVITHFFEERCVTSIHAFFVCFFALVVMRHLNPKKYNICT